MRGECEYVVYQDENCHTTCGQPVYKKFAGVRDGDGAFLCNEHYRHAETETLSNYCPHYESFDEDEWEYCKTHGKWECPECNCKF